MVDLLRNVKLFAEVILFLHHIWPALVRNVEQINIGLHIALLQQPRTHILQCGYFGLIIILLRQAVHHRLRHLAVEGVLDR